jgi:hypothetical protein
MNELLLICALAAMFGGVVLVERYRPTQPVTFERDRETTR